MLAFVSTAKRRTGDAIVIHSAVAGPLAVPTGTPVTGGLGPLFSEKIRASDGTTCREIEIVIVAAAGATLVGPVVLYGSEDPAAALGGATDQWNKIATLFAGASIVLPAAKAAYAERIPYAGCYRALQLATAAGAFGANVTVYVVPLNDMTN